MKTFTAIYLNDEIDSPYFILYWETSDGEKHETVLDPGFFAHAIWSAFSRQHYQSAIDDIKRYLLESYRNEDTVLEVNLLGLHNAVNLAEQLMLEGMLKDENRDPKACNLKLFKVKPDGK